jgi:hypothetical protein
MSARPYFWKKCHNLLQLGVRKPWISLNRALKSKIANTQWGNVKYSAYIQKIYFDLFAGKLTVLDENILLTTTGHGKWWKRGHASVCRLSAGGKKIRCQKHRLSATPGKIISYIPDTHTHTHTHTHLVMYLIKVDVVSVVTLVMNMMIIRKPQRITHTHKFTGEKQQRKWSINGRNKKKKEKPGRKFTWELTLKIWS